ncbi:hypothetical protein U6A24_23010 [Aquimarina gracilis]|uniref:DUF202 domain-containing protein n=1 Tax=Aquimarina gracilis TaxID=874422 RepID=A0ABU6A2Q9_9FLAO|nr:hypothetical protein [Aquimarina gracilis]MEB3348366.1 hypothetical protein [Aquimarina gracilis]
MEDQDHNPSRRTWNLMIGISIVLLGSLRLYNRLKEAPDWGIGTLSIVFFIVFGLYLILRYFQNNPKD